MKYCVCHHLRQLCSHACSAGARVPLCVVCSNQRQQSETALESAQVQIEMYNRLLDDKQRQIDLVTVERDVLQLENQQLDTMLGEMRNELE